MLVATLLLATVGRRATARQLRPVVWLVILVVGALIGLAAPGGIIFFLFPPSLVLIGILASRWWRHAEPVAAIAAIVMLYVTWGATLGLLEELLNSGPMWVFAPLGALLVLPALVEGKRLVDAAGLRAATMIAGVLTLGGWAAVAAAPAYSADRQQRFVIEHVTDAGSGKAYWSVLNNGVPLPDEYRSVGKWRWEKLPFGSAKRWLAPAPATNMQAPAVEVLGVVRNGAERLITLRLRSNGADRVYMMAPEDAQVRAAGSGEFVRAIDPAASDGTYALSCSGRGCDGATFQVRTTSPKPIVATLVGFRSGLPGSAAPLVAARPRFARPQYAPDESVAFRKMRL